MPVQGRKCKSTISEPQPERAGAVSRDDDAPRGPDHTSGWEVDLTIERDWGREAAENSPAWQAFSRELELITPFFFFQAHFPEEDGFEYVIGILDREVCYTQKVEGGEEVAVTIPRDHTCVFYAMRRGDTQTRINGIKQGGVVCLAVSILPPALASSETETAGSPTPPGNITDAAFDAAEQALLGITKQLQNPDVEGSNPVPDEWLEGCLAMVCVGSKTRVYEYSKAEGLCDSQADTGWMLLKADEELRRKSELPPRPLLQDAESLSKSTNFESKTQPEAEHTDSPKRETMSDPFPGVATPAEFALSYYTHEIAKTANDPFSYSSLRKRALEIPLAFFQGLWPKEDGFSHEVVGFLERDIHYTELKEGGEEVAVTIPWENTQCYLIFAKTGTTWIRCIALYALPPAVAYSEPKHADSPWGRGISGFAMSAVAQELQEVVTKFKDSGYNGSLPVGEYLDRCQMVVFVGLEMAIGSYSSEEGFQWSARSAVVADGYGLAAASDPSNYLVRD